MQCQTRDVYEKQIVDLQVGHESIYIVVSKDIFQKIFQFFPFSVADFHSFKTGLSKIVFIA